MENLIGKTNLVICSWYNVPTLFRNLQKEVFSGQGAWHSPNTLPHGPQAFHFIALAGQHP